MCFYWFMNFLCNQALSDALQLRQHTTGCEPSRCRQPQKSALHGYSLWRLQIRGEHLTVPELLDRLIKPKLIGVNLTHHCNWEDKLCVGPN